MTADFAHLDARDEAFRSIRSEHASQPSVRIIKPSEQWPEPDRTIIHPERPDAPEMSDQDFGVVFGPWASWIKQAAEVKSAPTDFVSLSLLTTASAIIGNTR